MTQGNYREKLQCISPALDGDLELEEISWEVTVENGDVVIINEESEEDDDDVNDYIDNNNTC